MSEAYESSVPIVFHASQKEERNAAIEEATLTNGIIQTVNSIEITQDFVVLRGEVHREILLSRSPGLREKDIISLKIRPMHTGKFHATWQATVSSLPPLGYLVFYPPFGIVSIYECLLEEDCDDLLKIDILLTRIGFSLPNGIIGTRLCSRCGVEIPEQRICALPSAKFCIRCQSILNEHCCPVNYIIKSTCYRPPLAPRCNYGIVISQFFDDHFITLTG